MCNKTEDMIKVIHHVRELAEDYEDDYSGYHLATKIIKLLDGEKND